MKQNIITQSLPEDTLESKIAYQGEFLVVAKDKVAITLPKDKSVTISNSGNTIHKKQLIATREYIKHPGATAIIAITKDNKIIITSQYRYAVLQTVLEIPAGKIDTNEATLICAKRELEEETGYIANSWTELGTCLPCIGYSDEKITYFLAQDLHYIKANPDEGEFIETQLIDLDNFINNVFSGAITDSKTICGIMLYLGYTKKISKSI